jgi:hypothetical protein
MSTTAYKYDVYISHAEADRPWVEQNLIPRLNAAKLGYCVDFEHFEPGAVTLDEAEKKIAASRKILLVVSSKYLKNTFSGFENRFARYLDPSARDRRSIPIIISPCKLPTSIEQLVKIDLRDLNTNAREKIWQRLILHLKDNTDEITAKTLAKPKTPKYPLLTKMERKLRMKKYHWINAGFSIPSEDFNFTAVYFENQLEVLSNVQTRIRSFINILKTKRINPSNARFMQDMYAMIDEIDSRSSQIAEVLLYEDEHPLSIAAQKATENFSANAASLRQLMNKSSVKGIVHASKVSEINRDLVTQLTSLLIISQELQKHLRKIYKFANASVYAR